MASRRIPLRYLLGLAGLGAVAATGIVVARGERRRRAMTAEEIRERLHRRYDELEATAAAAAAAPRSAAPETPRGRGLMRAAPWRRDPRVSWGSSGPDRGR